MNDPSAPAALLAKLTASGITIDVLVNNAGFCMVGVLEHTSDDEMCDQVETFF
jgi:short-subunit dehydrogenase